MPTTTYQPEDFVAECIAAAGPLGWLSWAVLSAALLFAWLGRDPRKGLGLLIAGWHLAGMAAVVAIGGYSFPERLNYTLDGCYCKRSLAVFLTLLLPALAVSMPVTLRCFRPGMLDWLVRRSLWIASIPGWIAAACLACGIRDQIDCINEWCPVAITHWLPLALGIAHGPMPMLLAFASLFSVLFAVLVFFAKPDTEFFGIRAADLCLLLTCLPLLFMAERLGLCPMEIFCRIGSATPITFLEDLLSTTITTFCLPCLLLVPTTFISIRRCSRQALLDARFLLVSAYLCLSSALLVVYFLVVLILRIPSFFFLPI
ncbi:MAG: hypothetical protein AAB215_09845 [Planctomycetota bacterium]